MLKIAYCGRVGSFSHEASVSMFPNEEFLPFNSFEEAVMQVEQYNCDYAVIPIENSTAGRVAEIHNLLPKINLYIVKERILAISHNLYSIRESVSLSQIKVVESHPQALMQCSNFLLPLNVIQEKSLNTAIAAENLTKSQDSIKAVICSKVAGRYYKLHLLKENIQNSDDNYTTFIAVGKNTCNEVMQRPITSIIFTISNKTGGIYEALGCFATNNVDLLKLESYIPTGVSHKAAQFFLTFKGSNNDSNVKNALSCLGSGAIDIKNLGSYNGDIMRFNNII